VLDDLEMEHIQWVAGPHRLFIYFHGVCTRKRNGLAGRVRVRPKRSSLGLGRLSIEITYMHRRYAGEQCRGNCTARPAVRRTERPNP